MAKPFYKGTLDVRMLPDGRTMMLLDDFIFVDSEGTYWTTRKCSKVNGSSIPRILWVFAKSPFVGKHREASIPHDMYCRIRTRSYKRTHRMFYEAMICSGVGAIEAAVKYWSVKCFGPRWDIQEDE